MLKRHVTAWAMLPALFAFASCSRPKTLDDEALRDSDKDAGNWLTYGRTYDDHRFSPLSQINEQTVGKLGLSLEPRTGQHTRPGSDAPRRGRRYLHHRQLERGLCRRCKDGSDPLDIRSQSASRAGLFLLL